MKILLAPDKFKGSLSALEVCHAMEEGIRAANPTAEVIYHPLADGGEGSIDLLGEILPLKQQLDLYPDPLQRPALSYFLYDEQRAYIEMAKTAGLACLDESEYNCLEADTLGVGFQVRDAIELGVKEIYLFVGGSATNDGGVGMATALGYRFLDKDGKEIPPSGGFLALLERIVPPSSSLLSNTKVKVITDVKNPLLGPNGSTYVYALQKGIREEELPFLEAGMEKLAEAVKRDLGKDIAQLEGAGAAGGLGAGAVAFLDAEILPGIDTLMDLTGFAAAIEEVDMILTGEGQLDHQSLQGKVIEGVARQAKSKEKPLAIFCGSLKLSEKDLRYLGATHVSPILKDGISLETAMNEGYDLLKKEVETWMKKLIA